jgi:RNA polymerase sigma-70 factor (ECF subfamily)
MSSEQGSVSPTGQYQVRVGLTQNLDSLRSRALRLCRDRQLADELVQETALRALTFEVSFQPGTNVKAWLFQILFSVFVTHCRKRRRASRFLSEHASDPNLWCDQNAHSKLREGLSPPVQRAIEALPENFGAVLVLVDLQDQSYGEAAAVLGVPIGTVMSRLHRGRRLLAANLTAPEGREAA